MNITLLITGIFFLLIAIFSIYKIRSIYDKMLEKLIVCGYSIDILTNGGECTIQNFLKISKKITGVVKEDIDFKGIRNKLIVCIILAALSFIMTTVSIILYLNIIENIISISFYFKK